MNKYSNMTNIGWSFTTLPLGQADLVRQEYEVLYEKTCAAKGAAQKNC